jgi:O-antigen ligase
MTFDAGTHNMFMDTLADSGVPGLLLLIGFWGIVALRFARSALAELRLGVKSERDPPCIAMFLSFVVITMCAIAVNFRLGFLGFTLEAAILWLMIVTIHEERLGATGSSSRS